MSNRYLTDKEGEGIVRILYRRIPKYAMRKGSELNQRLEKVKDSEK